MYLIFLLKGAISSMNPAVKYININLKVSSVKPGCCFFSFLIA